MDPAHDMAIEEVEGHQGLLFTDELSPVSEEQEIGLDEDEIGNLEEEGNEEEEAISDEARGSSNKVENGELAIEDLLPKTEKEEKPLDAAVYETGCSGFPLQPALDSDRGREQRQGGIKLVLEFLRHYTRAWSKKSARITEAPIVGVIVIF